MYTPASVGKIGILSVKKNDSVITRYRPDLGNAEINIPTSDVRSSTTGKFNTTTGGLLESCDVTLTPKQDLHGYDNPWVGGSGKNKLNSTLESKAQAGLIYTALGDGTYNVDGTASANGGAEFVTNITLKAGSYKIVGLPSDVGSSSCYIGLMKDGSYVYSSNDASFTLSADTTFDSLRLRPGNGKQFDNVIVKPMITTDLTATYDDFEPYANICPITGHSSVEVDVTDADSNTTQYIVALGQTVYSGTLDAVSGVLTVDRGFYEFDGTENWAKSTNTSCDVYMTSRDDFDLSNPFITSAFKYTPSTTLAGGEARRGSSDKQLRVGFATYGTTTLADFISWLTTNHMQIVWQLATPLNIQLTPTQIETLIGENNITTPLEKQSLNSLTYKEMMSWDDVSDNFKAYMNSVGDNSFTFSQGNDTESVTIVDHSRAKAECLAYINAQEGMVAPDMAYKAYAVGEHFMHKGKFCTAITAIAQGDMLVANTNYVEGTIADYITSKDITNDLTWNTSGNTFAHYSASISGNVVTINVRFSATVVSANHVLVSIPDKYMPKSGWYFGNIMKSWYGTPISAVVYKMSTTGQLYLPDVTTFETSVGYVGSFTYII